MEESGKVRVGKIQGGELEMPNTFVEVQAYLLKAMQTPLITPWWTIGSLAILTTQHFELFLLLAKGVCNMMTTIQKDNTSASNLLSLPSSEWIVTDILFINGISKAWLNPDMKFYQSKDQNVGEPGFLFFHCQVLYSQMLEARYHRS